MKEVRGIDLDEVKFETLDSLLDFHNHQINGNFVTREDITDYHLYKIKKLGIDISYANTLWKTFNSSDKVADIKPVVGAKEVLEQLKAQGKTLISITGRSDKNKGWTFEALQKHYTGIISDVIFLNAYRDFDMQNFNSNKITQRTKSEICKEFGATVMVEDDLHYAQELADNGIKVYLLAKPWNQEYHNGIHPNIIKIDKRENIIS